MDIIAKNLVRVGQQYKHSPYLFTDTVHHAVDIHTIVIRTANTTIVSLYDHAGNNLIKAINTNEPYNISGVNFLVGEIITCPNQDEPFSGVQLEDGEIWAYPPLDK